jgi:hypothetical protein
MHGKLLDFAYCAGKLIIIHRNPTNIAVKEAKRNSKSLILC